jgi:hypothetical protein
MGACGRPADFLRTATDHDWFDVSLLFGYSLYDRCAHTAASGATVTVSTGLADVEPLADEEPGGRSHGFEGNRVDESLAVVLDQLDTSAVVRSSANPLDREVPSGAVNGSGASDPQPPRIRTNAQAGSLPRRPDPPSSPQRSGDWAHGSQLSGPFLP